MLSSQAAVTATITADAATDIITSAAHGLSNGDTVTFFNSGGALPTGISAATYYYVITATTNTFQISATVGGSALDITGAGSGTNKFAKEFEFKVFCADFEQSNITVDATGTPTVTIFFNKSNSETAPTFLYPESSSNQFFPIQVLDENDWIPVDGTTGLVLSANKNASYKMNFDGARYMGFRTRGFQAGTLNIKAKLFNNS